MAIHPYTVYINAAHNPLLLSMCNQPWCSDAIGLSSDFLASTCCLGRANYLTITLRTECSFLRQAAIIVCSLMGPTETHKTLQRFVCVPPSSPIATRSSMPPKGKKRARVDSDSDDYELSGSDADVGNSPSSSSLTKETNRKPTRNATKRTRNIPDDDDEDYDLSAASESEHAIKMPSVSARRGKRLVSATQEQDAIQMPAYSPEGNSTRKKVKKTVEPAGEKRLARFKLKCPEDVRDRYNLTTKKFYILGRNKINDVEEHFKIATTTNVEISNIFTVTIAHRLRCDCPHGQKALNNCEHILTVLWHVLKVPSSSNLWYQKALLTSELTEIFAAAPITSSRPKSGEKKAQSEAFDCPICFSRFYDKINNNPNSESVWCSECGEMIHRGCLEQWRKANDRTCVSCGPLSGEN